MGFGHVEVGDHTNLLGADGEREDILGFELGNELGGAWEPGDELPFGKGRITAEMYTKRYNEMAKAMRQVDPTIKIGSCPFVEEALRDCGDNVDFVSIHTYPGSTTLSDAKMFADIAANVATVMMISTGRGR